MKGYAKFGPDRKWRWWLARVWDDSLPMAALIGMNPSRADAEQNDPTILKSVTFVRSWGFGSMLMLNAFAYVATNPADLYTARSSGVDVVGSLNSAACLAQLLTDFHITKTVACWGKLRTDRGWLLRDELTARGVKLDCFRKNSDGSPSHPLYLPWGLLPEPWNYV